MGENLTSKQKKFVQEYLTNGNNAAKAAISAGYSEKSAKEIGCENLTKPNIKRIIDLTLKKEAEKFEVTRESLAKEYNEAIELSKLTLQTSSMVSAITGKAKLFGLDIQKLEVEGGDKPIKHVVNHVDIEDRIKQLTGDDSEDYLQ